MAKTYKKKNNFELEITTPIDDKIDVWKKDFITNKISDIDLQIALLEHKKEDLQEILDKFNEFGIKSEKEEKDKK